MGDAIHNARCALDHVAYQLFLANRGTPAAEKDIAFPISGSVAHYAGLANRRLAGVSAPARAAIDALNPYRGGDNRFYQLSELDNTQKHRLLLVVAAQLQSINVIGGRDKKMMREFMARHAPEARAADLKFPDFFVRPADPMWPLKPGDDLFIDLPDAEPDPEREFRFELAFGESGICDGDNVLEKLNELTTLAESVVIGLEPHL